MKRKQTLIGPRYCARCKEPFWRIRTNALYCSRKCSNAAEVDRTDKRLARREHSPEEWGALLEAWGWKCFYCGDGIHMWNATKDHQIPLSKGGSDRIENIVPSCRACNNKKGSKVQFGPTKTQMRIQAEKRGEN